MIAKEKVIVSAILIIFLAIIYTTSLYYTAPAEELLSPPMGMLNSVTNALLTATGIISLVLVAVTMLVFGKKLTVKK